MGPAKYAGMITEEELSAHLSFFASDFFLGRKAGTMHEREAARYLASFYQSSGIPSLSSQRRGVLEDYFQEFTVDIGGRPLKSQNVMAFLEGSNPVLKDEVVVLVAHYDHLGVGAAMAGDSIFNGAADDGSGTVALMELAESLAEARRGGVTTARSILFLHTGAEEAGLHGSVFFVRNPPLPLDRIAAVVNLDGVGGTDKPGEAPNYVYLLYNDSTARPLAKRVPAANAREGIKLEILQPAQPQRFNSDNKPFEYELVPSLYFSTGLTEHYHKVTDEPGTIDYRHMARITRLVFNVTWDLANARLERPPAQRSQFRKTGTYFCVPCGCKLDATAFPDAGICPDCRMALHPRWSRR